MTAGQYRRALADLVAEVSEGAIGAEEALAGERSLSALGLTSVARVRLVDAIEDTFGIEVGLGGDWASLESVDALAALVSRAAEPADRTTAGA
ncbi:acyl carrier protein [Microbispora sp. H10949]|uniref:acyl carrier protein n=1 Tax=Microbispora sp. H10949 TaxID=2729111 RepID=UPI00160332E1|nr:acyl carrier protein [Microbispora sp. H10949]